MISIRRPRRTNIITAYVMAVILLFLGRQLISPSISPAREPVENALIFISDTDSIDAGRNSNSVYRIGLDGRGLKRIAGSIPHGAGYLRSTDIDCHAASQALLIASHQRDLNGFHHARLDGSGLHLDRPAAGDLLTATRQIAIAPDGRGIVVSRQFEGFAEPRFGLVAGDLFTRYFGVVKSPTAERSYISPDFSPAGRLLAYISRRDDAAGRGSSLILADRASGREQIIYETSRQISEVVWSPTGEWLALVVDRQIYRMHPFGGAALIRLTDHLGGATSPRWSPDGAQISYVTPSTYPGLQQIMTMNADGSDKQRLTNIRGDLVNGCWL